MILEPFLTFRLFLFTGLTVTRMSESSPEVNNHLMANGEHRMDSWKFSYRIRGLRFEFLSCLIPVHISGTITLVPETYLDLLSPRCCEASGPNIKPGPNECYFLFIYSYSEKFKSISLKEFR